MRQQSKNNLLARTHQGFSFPLLKETIKTNEVPALLHWRLRKVYELKASLEYTVRPFLFV